MPTKLDKIMIFGRPGSGKSTFAFWLHKKINLPLYHLDKYFYIDNWTKSWIERDYNEFLKIQKDIVNKNNWIVDGNCLSSLELRYNKADICIYFDYPRYICYLRIFKRYFYKDKNIKDRAEGYTETLNLKFLKYIWNFENR
ncbi:MAG: DNA topology modulation protein [Bacteroidetes bacterium]|nr:DNA topology modulation protein [Bacteroidota bacterium]